MPFYRSRLEYTSPDRRFETEPKLIHVDDEPLSFVRLHGFGPQDVRGRHLLLVDVLSHDEAVVTSSKSVDVFVESGKESSGNTNIRQIRLKPGETYHLRKSSLYLPDRPKERIHWTPSMAEHLSDF